jgi:hypothetical protein
MKGTKNRVKDQPVFFHENTFSPGLIGLQGNLKIKRRKT